MEYNELTKKELLNKISVLLNNSKYTLEEKIVLLDKTITALKTNRSNINEME